MVSVPVHHEARITPKHTKTQAATLNKMKTKTNPLGAGTVNVSVNMGASEKLVLGQLACALDLSLGELLRHLIYTGATQQSQELGGKLQALKGERKGELA
jgi:hypothetical protein